MSEFTLTQTSGLSLQWNPGSLQHSSRVAVFHNVLHPLLITDCAVGDVRPWGEKNTVHSRTGNSPSFIQSHFVTTINTIVEIRKSRVSVFQCLHFTIVIIGI